MANEAVLIYETENAIPFTVADGTGIEKGTLLTMTDPMTASAGTDASYCAGIAKNEKIASDGKTKLSVYRRGIFKVKASGSITAGQTLSLAGDNYVKASVGGTTSGSKVCGIALETATAGETFYMELNPAVMVN
jgi:hypothetical protein